jgi:hypothetical protein
MQNQTNFNDDDGDPIDICTYCGTGYNPEQEGHTEMTEDEQEATGNFFCSPECEMHHYRGGDNPGLL